VTELRREAPKVLSCAPTIGQQLSNAWGSGVAGLKSSRTIARNRDHLQLVPLGCCAFSLENLLDGISIRPLKEFTS
jgi:hypothetical protein